MEDYKHSKKESAGRLIGGISRAGLVYFQHAFKPYNIGHAQIRTLFHVAHNEGLTQKQIAEYLNLDKSSITSQLQILEKNGYICRVKSDEDARKQVIGITDKTKEVLPMLKQVLTLWTQTLLDGFDDTEKEELFSYLMRMQENAQQKLSELCKG